MRFLSLIQLPSLFFLSAQSSCSTHSVLLCLLVIVLLLCFMFCEERPHPLFVVCVVHTPFCLFATSFVENHSFATIQQKLLLQRCPGRRLLSFLRASLWTELSALCFSLTSPPLQRAYPLLSLCPMSRMQNRMHSSASCSAFLKLLGF